MSEDKPIKWGDQTAHFGSCLALTLITLGFGAPVVVVKDSLSNRFLYNYYHRVWKEGQGTFSINRTNIITTYIEINTEIRCNFILGVSEDAIKAYLNGSYEISTGLAAVAIGFDSTTVPQTGLTALFQFSVANAPMHIGISGPAFGLAVGFHFATVLGHNAGAGTETFNAVEDATNAKCYLQIEIKM